MNGEDAMVTVLFADLRDFTPFADRVTAREAVALPDHADRAVAAAGVIAEAVDAHFGARCRVSVGVNTGLVLVGTIGGGSRFELAIIGDPVNVAARVEQATRATGDAVLITEATRCMLEGPDRLVARGAVSLKGKAAPVAVYALASSSRTPLREPGRSPVTAGAVTGLDVEAR